MKFFSILFIFIQINLFSQEGTDNLDNYIVKHYTTKDGLPSNTIYNCVNDDMGYIWFATENGLSRFDGIHFKNYDVKDGLKDNMVLGVTKFKDVIIAQGFKGKTFFHNSKLLKVNRENLATSSMSAMSFFIDDLYFHSISDNFQKFNIYKVDSKMNFNLVDSQLNPNVSNRLKFKIPLESLWLNNTIKLKETGQFLEFISKPYQNITSIKLYSSQLELLNQFDVDFKYGSGVTFFKNIFNIVNNNLISVFEILKSKILLKKSLNSGVKNITCLEQIDDETYFLNTSIEGFYMLNKKNKISNINHIENERYRLKVINNKSVKCFVKYNKKYLILGTNQGFYLYDIMKNSILVETLISNNVSRSLFSKRVYSLYLRNYNLDLYCGTIDGLYKYKLSNFTYFKIEIPLNNDAKINSIAQDKYKNLWVSSAGNGVFVLDTNYKTIQNLQVKDGLTSNDNYKIVIDAKNRKWLTSNLGVLVIDGNRKTRIDEEEGLISNEVQDLYVSGDTAWIYTNKGCNQYVYKNDTSTTIIPFYFNSFLLNNKLLDSLPSILKPDQNKIQFNFIGIYYTSPGNINYKYRLVRNNDNSQWQVTKETKLILENLQDGNYKLEIQAFHNNYPNIYSKVNRFSFKIKPYYYNTWWFIGLLFLLAFSLVSSFYWYRNKNKIQQLKLKGELNKYKLQGLQQQMNPHFIFNSMSTIQDFILTKQNSKALDFISDFSELMRSMLQNSRNELISLKSEIKFLKQYIELEQVRYESSFDFLLNIDFSTDELEEIYIPTMIIQPLIENAIKHGLSNLKERKGRLELNFSLINDETSLKVQIKDNGLGKSKSLRSKNHNSTALKVIQERLAIFSKNGRIGEFSLNYLDLETISILIIPI